MPSPPPLFDDEGEAGAGGTEETAPSSRAPNYLVRRAVVVGGVVAVIATAAIVIGQLMDRSGDDDPSGTIGAEWNRIVLVDPRTGVVTISDETGDERGRVQTRIRDVTDIRVVGPTLVLTSAATVAVVDLDAESVSSFELEVSPDGVVMPSGSALTMIGHDPSGRRALIVHGPSGEHLDTEEFAPVIGADYGFELTRSDPSGRHLLVTDAGNFQSVLFSFDRDEPSFFPGLALAVDGDIVVTAQNVGNDATVSVFDHDGEPVTSGRTPSVRAAMIAGDVVHLVTVAGQVVTMSTITGVSESGEQLAIGTAVEGHVATSGDRLVVVGSAGTAVVDEGGAALGSYGDLEPEGSAIDRGAPRRAPCLVLAGEGQARDVVLVDMTDGEALAEATFTEALLASADGCSAIAPTAEGYDIITTDAVRSIPSAGDVVALSPDGRLVVSDRNGRLRLVPADPTGDADAAGSDDDPVDTDLGPSRRLIAFTQL
jgi:hypothetical protein